jgi:hypothetical protein
VPDVISLMETDTRFIRKWGNKLLAVADYDTLAPAEWFDVDALPVLPSTMKQMGFITSDGVQINNSVSASTVMMEQSINPVRSDIDSVERTLVVTFGESNAWTKALYYGLPVSTWAADKYTPTDFDDEDFVDYPYLRLAVLASDGVGAQAFYRVEYAYRAKVTGLGNRTLQRSGPETRQFTFSIYQDPQTGKAVREVENGPGFAHLIAPTGAAAGTPGHFTPTGAYAPANLAALQGAGIAASPSTAWTTGQYVALGDASHAHWSGTAWVTGSA